MPNTPQDVASMRTETNKQMHSGGTRIMSKWVLIPYSNYFHLRYTIYDIWKPFCWSPVPRKTLSQNLCCVSLCVVVVVVVTVVVAILAHSLLPAPLSSWVYS